MIAKIWALKNHSGSQLIKNSYVRIQVGKRLNNNDRRRHMAINDFIISTLNVSDDMFFSIDTHKSSDKLHILIKLNDTHPTCPCCGGHTKVKDYSSYSYNHLTLQVYHPSLIGQEDAMSEKNVGSPSLSQVHLAQRTSTSHTQYSLRLPWIYTTFV